MCWNEWPSLTKPTLPGLPVSVEVCKNCDRGIKKVLSFSRFHGVDLATGEIAPQVGTNSAQHEAEEPSPSPSRKPSKGG
jgi:hypothetical protein